MVEEARLEAADSGLAPDTDGWFVVNARDAAWLNNDYFGGVCIFEADNLVLRGRPDLDEQTFPGAGFTLRVVKPGQPAGLYHAETNQQEDFLILMGECVLLIGGEERPLRAWDFVHCPPGTTHTFVGAGDSPCVILGVQSHRGLDHGAPTLRTRPPPRSGRRGGNDLFSARGLRRMAPRASSALERTALG